MNKLDPILEQEFTKKIEEGNYLEEQGKIPEAIKHYLSVWAVFPKPQYSYEIAKWLINCLYGAYFDNEDYANAKKWAEEELKCSHSDYDVSPFINLGRVYFELGDQKKAYDNFCIAYEKGKYRAFQEDDPKYWQFFKSLHKI